MFFYKLVNRRNVLFRRECINQTFEKVSAPY